MSDKYLNDTGLSHFWSKIKAWVNSKIATDTDYGFVKLNPSQSIGVDSDGKLTVGGRLGQFPDGGIYYAADREPIAVGANFFLVTDAMGYDAAGNRGFAVVSGVGFKVKGNHPAGSTEYHFANTYANRIQAMSVKYMSLDEATSKVQPIVKVLSCTVGGVALTPSSANDDPNNDIIITVEQSANPNNAVNNANMRTFGNIGQGCYASAYIGSGVGAAAGGANFILGQGVYSTSGNMNVIFGQYHWNKGNGNSVLGRWHISTKNRWLLAGTGHDNTNGMAEAGAAVGAYSDITSNTLFAVGNGTSATARKNAFEVVDGGIVIPSSTSGSTKKFKITVDDSGNITATEVV